MGSRVRVPPRSPCFSNKTCTFRSSHLEYLYGRLARFVLRLANSCSGAVPSLWRPGARWPRRRGIPGGPAKPLRNEIARWGYGKLAVGSPRRLGGDRWSVLVPGQNPAARYGSLEPIDEVDYTVKGCAGTGSNAASGDGQMCLAGVWPRRRDRFVSR
jgi:hypothetical protein